MAWCPSGLWAWPEGSHGAAGMTTALPSFAASDNECVFGLRVDLLVHGRGLLGGDRESVIANYLQSSIQCNVTELFMRLQTCNWQLNQESANGPVEGGKGLP